MEKVRERVVWNETEEIEGVTHVKTLEVMLRNTKFRFYFSHDKKPFVSFKYGICGI